MSQPTTRQIIAKQVTRARRRLISQLLLRHLAVAWTVGLAVTVLWMLAEPHAVANPPSWLRWAVLGGTLGTLTIFAILQTIRRAPSRTDAALALDDRFGLRERVVTVLSLTPDLDATPAGVALLADAEGRVKAIRVRERFSVGLPWSSALVPAGGLAVALVAFFYHPSFPAAQGETAQNQVAPEKKKEIEKKLEGLAKKPRTTVKPEERQKSEDLKRLEARLDEIAKKPRDTREQLRDRIKDLTPLEEEFKKLERDRTEKARMLQQQLQAKDKMEPNDVPKDGPASEFSKRFPRATSKRRRTSSINWSRSWRTTNSLRRKKKSWASSSTASPRKWKTWPSRRTSKSNSRNVRPRASSIPKPCSVRWTRSRRTTKSSRTYRSFRRSSASASSA